MLGREIMQFILDNSLEDEEIVAVNAIQVATDPDDAQQFSIVSLSTDTNDDGDTVGVFTVAE